MLTFGFGLVHGLGFAGALAGLGLERASSRVLPLVSFNLGVEIGQACVIAVAFVAVSRLRAVSFGTYGVRVASLLVGLAGAFWFVERTFVR